MTDLHIATSGWSYDHWAGVFYDPGLAPARRLGVYTSVFDTVELNSSFYRWPRPEAFASWRRRLPTGFVMSVKAPRGLTHAKRLYAPEQWIERITAGWHELADKRGVLLVQLAPGHERDDARLDYFLSRLPPWIRVAVEFRHPSWGDSRVFDILAAHQAAYCVMSGAGLSCVLQVTAPFTYVRLHGPDTGSLYAGSYSDQDLAWWGDRIGEWRSEGTEVFGYFNNDQFGFAVANARTLNRLIRPGRPT